MLKSPAELKPRPSGSVIPPPGPLHLPLGLATKHCLSPPLGILASGLSKVRPEVLLLPIWGPTPKNSNPGISRVQLPNTPFPDQDAQALVPHTCPLALLHTGHRESQGVECPDRGSDRAVVSRWRR